MVDRAAAGQGAPIDWSGAVSDPVSTERPSPGPASPASSTSRAERDAGHDSEALAAAQKRNLWRDVLPKLVQAAGVSALSESIKSGVLASSELASIVIGGVPKVAPEELQARAVAMHDAFVEVGKVSPAGLLDALAMFQRRTSDYLEAAWGPVGRKVGTPVALNLAKAALDFRQASEAITADVVRTLKA